MTAIQVLEFLARRILSYFYITMFSLLLLQKNIKMILEKQLLDLKIFLHAKENLKVIRRIKRDRVERNYPLDDVLYRYENHVLPTFEKYIQPYMEQCDIVINNNTQFDRGLEVVIGFLKQRLQQQ